MQQGRRQRKNNHTVQELQLYRLRLNDGDTDTLSVFYPYTGNRDADLSSVTLQHLLSCCKCYECHGIVEHTVDPVP